MKRQILSKHSRFIQRSINSGLGYQHVQDAIRTREGVEVSIRTLSRFMGSIRARKQRRAETIGGIKKTAPAPVKAVASADADAVAVKHEGAQPARQIGVVAGPSKARDLVSDANKYCTPGGVGIGLKSLGKE